MELEFYCLFVNILVLAYHLAKSQFKSSAKAYVKVNNSINDKQLKNLQGEELADTIIVDASDAENMEQAAKQIIE